VEILDEAHRPAAFVRAYGLFTGGAFGPVTGVTDAQGLVTFQSPPLEGTPLVGFQVDAVTAGRGHGSQVIFDRPQGFVRIDSDSLALLSSFGRTLSAVPSGAGAASETSPSGAGGPSGAGPETTPSFELPSDPSLTPITIAFDPSLFGGDYRRTLLLPNFSWSLATTPMAVAADEEWFLAAFPGAAARRVVSRGRGVGSSAHLFDASSFPVSVDYVPSPTRVPLIVVTFTSGVVTMPAAGSAPSSLLVDVVYGGLDASHASACESVLAAFYAADAAGTTPTYESSGAGLSEAQWAHLGMVARSYLAFAPLVIAAPVAVYGEALNVAGVSIAPSN
jgi:hypothetical protein